MADCRLGMKATRRTGERGRKGDESEEGERDSV